MQMHVSIYTACTLEMTVLAAKIAHHLRISIENESTTCIPIWINLVTVLVVYYLTYDLSNLHCKCNVLTQWFDVHHHV